MFTPYNSAHQSVAKLASLDLSGRLLSRASYGACPLLSPSARPAFTGLLPLQRSRSLRPTKAHPSRAPFSSQGPLSLIDRSSFNKSYLVPTSRRDRRRTGDYILYNPQTSRLFPPRLIAELPGVGHKPMRCYYQVITTPTADTPGTIIAIHFDDKRYLFGQIAEGTQRASTERGFRFTNLSDIFITGRTEWATNGGLIGTVLSQAEMRRAETSPPVPHKKGEKSPEKPFLGIHGGRNLTHTIATARRFVFRKGMPMDIREYDSESLSRIERPVTEDPFELPSWTDENIKVWAMPVSPGSAAAPQSPRKRSRDEFQEDKKEEGAVDQWTRDQLMRRGVVSDMFHSSWRADALIAKPLADVAMPAKVFIRNPVTKDIEVYKGPVPGGKQPVPDIEVLVRRPWPGAEIESLPPTTRCDEALSYIVRTHDLRGRFDPKKAAELNVPKGPCYGQLANGKEVQSTDGRTITPDMVLGPTRIGKAMAIIDLPTPAYVDSLINRPEWKSCAPTTELKVFFWLLGPGVGDHPRLREFISRYPQCEHIVSSTDNCPNYLALGRVAETSIRLARLKGDNYSIPVHDNVTLPQPGTGSAKSSSDSLFVPAEPGLKINIEPEFGLNRSEIPPPLNATQIVHRIPRAVEQRMMTTHYRTQKGPFQQKLAELQRNLPGADAEVVALGTGSSNPSRYRNVSATLVHAPGYGYYLLDCGEATLGQLKRVFDHEELAHILRNLRMIWISHLHADHHLGTVSVIKAWYKENYGTEMPTSTSIEPDMSNILQEKRLFVVSDEMMILWLEEYSAVENFGFGKVVALSASPYEDHDGKLRTAFTYRHTRDDGTYPDRGTSTGKPATTTLRFDQPSSLTSLLESATGLSDLLTAPVHHCRGALAGSFVFPNGFKFSYSGDCRPSQRFAEIGHRSSILIHEATFQDEMHGSAIAKKHSTTAEALEVGRRMEARTILLTHFSQRYQKAALVDTRFGTTKNEMGMLSHAEQLDYEDVDDIPRLQDSSVSSDEIVVSNPDHLYKLPTPVAAAFDYMRIRVGDIPLAQAFEPVLNKLFATLEKEAAREAEKAREEAERAKAGTGKKAKKRAAEEAAKTEEKAAAISSAEKEKNEKSPFSASESESGWETSEPEEMGRGL